MDFVVGLWWLFGTCVELYGGYLLTGTHPIVAMLLVAVAVIGIAAQVVHIFK